MSFGAKVSRSALWAIVGQGVTALLAIANFAVVGRFIEPAEYGNFLAALMVLTATQWLASNAYKEPLVQASELNESQLNSVFTFTFIVALVLTLIMIMIGMYSQYHEISSVVSFSIFILAFKLFFDTLQSVPAALRIRNLDFKFFAGVLVTSNLIATAINIGMLFRGYGVISLAWSQLLSSIISFLMFFYFGNRAFRLRMRLIDLTLLRAYSPHVILWQGMDAIGQTLDRYLIASRLTFVDLGLYGFGKRLNDVVIDILVGATSSVSLPAFSQLQNDPLRLQAAFLKSVRMVALMVLPTIALLYVTAEEFIPLFLGPKWTGAIPVYRWFLLLGVIQAVGILQGSLLRSFSKQGMWTRYMFAQCIANIIVLFFVAGYGIEVLAAAIVIRVYVLWVWIVIKTCQVLKIKVRYYMVELLKPLSIAVVSATGGLMIRNLFPDSILIVKFFIEGAVVISIFLILVFVFLRGSALEAISLIKNIISKR